MDETFKASRVQPTRWAQLQTVDLAGAARMDQIGDSEVNRGQVSHEEKLEPGGWVVIYKDLQGFTRIYKDL